MSLRAEIMALPDAERLEHALALLEYHLEPAPAWVDCAMRRQLTLSAAQYRILAALDRARGRTLSYRTLCAAAAGRGAEACDSTAQVHICRIRAQIRRRRLPLDIITERGIGYRLEAAEGFSWAM